MSRSGYYEDMEDPLAHGRWRAIVSSTMRSKRGQAFLKEMLAALDALPEKRLIDGHLLVEQPDGTTDTVDDGGSPFKPGDCCAMGAVAIARGLDAQKVDPEDPESVAGMFGIHDAMAREIAYYNDESGETPEQRWVRMRAWVESRINK